MSSFFICTWWFALSSSLEQPFYATPSLAPSSSSVYLYTHTLQRPLLNVSSSSPSYLLNSSAKVFLLQAPSISELPEANSVLTLCKRTRSDFCLLLVGFSLHVKLAKDRLAFVFHYCWFKWKRQKSINYSALYDCTWPSPALAPPDRSVCLGDTVWSYIQLFSQYTH